jgi:hypothetical protein
MKNKVSINHPYKKFKATVLWRVVENQISALVRNGDIRELTAREYIVGSICKAVAGSEEKK